MADLAIGQRCMIINGPEYLLWKECVVLEFIGSLTIGQRISLCGYTLHSLENGDFYLVEVIGFGIAGGYRRTLMPIIDPDADQHRIEESHPLEVAV